jgi:hypothetical protein
MTEAVTPGDDVPDHSHDFRVVSVDFDAGVSTQELRCDGCGAVWFR